MGHTSTEARRTKLEASARRALLERHRVLAAARGRAEQDAQELYETREPNWEDAAANVAAAVHLDSLAASERAELRLVTAALERLDQGIWGACVRCGREIDAGRLRTAPEAARCLECTELDER